MKFLYGVRPPLHRLVTNNKIKLIENLFTYLLMSDHKYFDVKHQD